MPFQFSCPHCGYLLTAPESAAGASGPCPNCDKRVTAPAPTVSGANGATQATLPVPQQGAGQPAPLPACPFCGSAAADKLNVIFETLRRIGAQLSSGVWQDHPRWAIISTGQAERVLRLLQPPVQLPPPEQPDEWHQPLLGGLLMVLMGLAIGGVVGSVLSFLLAQSRYSEAVWRTAFIVPTAAGILIPCAATAFHIMRTVQDGKEHMARFIEYRRQHVACENARQRWDALYLCPDCGMAYDPVTGRNSQVANLRDLLYEEPAG